jgi:hypothetical protein
MHQNKKTSEEVFHCAYAWLGLEGVVQPFEEDQDCDIDAIRQMLNEDEEEPSC